MLTEYEEYPYVRDEWEEIKKRILLIKMDLILS